MGRGPAIVKSVSGTMERPSLRSDASLDAKASIELGLARRRGTALFAREDVLPSSCGSVTWSVDAIAVRALLWTSSALSQST